MKTNKENPSEENEKKSHKYLNICDYKTLFFPKPFDLKPDASGVGKSIVILE